MKNFFQQILNKPKVVIPVVAAIAVVVGVIAYVEIGRVPAAIEADRFVADSTNPNQYSVDLAFPKGGRIATVNVKVGDQIKKGETMASLEAGDALGLVTQTRGALNLARAQYASLDVQYSNAKKQQDVLVQTALNTLLSSDLTAVAEEVTTATGRHVLHDAGQTPTISGTYTCGKEGEYRITPYRTGSSGTQTGYNFKFTGLETGSGIVDFYSPQALGSCGLYIQFPAEYSASNVVWVVSIPNALSSDYVKNKNVYDLAVATRDQVLNQYQANLGRSSAANTAQASIDAAEGAYQAALGAYNNTLIVAPTDGTVSYVDSDLKVGQSVTANKTVITITQK